MILKKKTKVYGIVSIVFLLLLTVGILIIMPWDDCAGEPIPEPTTFEISPTSYIDPLRHKHYVTDGWYTIENGEIILLSYSGESTYFGPYRAEVMIPSEIEGMKVTSLQDFSKNYSSFDTKEIKVTVPDSIVSISDYAFENVYILTDITLGKGITSVGEGTFCECFGLENITFCGEITSIGKRGFYGCRSLEKIFLPDSIATIGDSAFEHCYNLADIHISTSTISIGSNVFAYCTALKSVTIPDSVTNIGKKAFFGCNITVTAPHEPEYYGYTPDEGVTWVVE